MLSKCCCCISLRTGSLIIAILGILGGIIFLGHSMTFHGFLILVVPVYGFLLYGAIERNEYAVLVWLLFNGVAIVLKIILGIIVIVGIIFIANIRVMIQKTWHQLRVLYFKFKAKKRSSKVKLIR